MGWTAVIAAGLIGNAAPTEGLTPTHRLVRAADGGVRLALEVAGRPIVTPTGPPLCAKSPCDVRVTAQPVLEGCLLHVTIANRGAAPAEMPDLAIGGITLPRDGVEIIENWKNIRFKSPGEKRRTQYYLHAIRKYPGGIYSPVMGIRTRELFLGVALMYEPLEADKEVHLDYTYDYKAKLWSMVYRFWDQPAKRVEVKDSKTGEVRRRPVAPPVAKLAPGRSMNCTLAVCVAPADGARWVTAFRPYRDFFAKTYGKVRYRATHEPIWARSAGIWELCSAENPRGYNSRSAGDQQGRLDQKGWAGFHDWVMKDVWARGFRRMMIWQVAGSYWKNRHTNMVWEIGTGHSRKMLQTAAGEIERLRKRGFTVGFWWGRAFTVSEGFDTGKRHALDPANAADVAAAYRELDAAHAMGVRLVGCDDSPHSLYPTDWKPSIRVLHETWLPMLYRRYPDMQWAIETAACDLQHIWGSSFMWSREVTGPCTFAHYVVPGSETNVTIKRRYGNISQEWLDQLLKWGYTPIVFNSQLRLSVSRNLLAQQHRTLPARPVRAALDNKVR